MSGHHNRVIERHCDVLVVGGSAAGLAAALQLGRQRRSVIVVDAGEPRNAPAAVMHSFLGRDGTPPSELTDLGREEVRSYGGEVLDGRVVDVTRHGEAFTAELAGGHAVVARRLLVATGLVDVLPDIDGVAEHWGRGVIHCPFCHGYEVRDRRIVQIVSHPMGLHPAALFRQLTDAFTVVVHDDDGIGPDQLDALVSAGVRVERTRAARLTTGSDGTLVGVELESGDVVGADAVVVGPRFEVATAPFASLGLTSVPHPTGLGTIIETDGTGATAVPGVWAAGNVTDPTQQVLQAAADGSRVGGMIAVGLAHDDLRAGGRHSSNQADWDRRYAGDRIWSGNPNGALVAEFDGAAPGTVLDVGAGEGGDAIWLAERGWAVTASDISTTALAVIAAEAERRELHVECLHADANALDPYGGRQFDLVTAHYASIPRTGDGRAIRNLLGAVAPGGTLLMVSHDTEPMRHPIDTRTTSRAFDPDAYVRVDDVEVALRNDPAWTIDVAEKRPRPPGAASASLHVDDIVIRARRSTTSSAR
ncbi:MAG: bifunctional NAD(P)/FAD-dependent oxidoreductase/class I SAM-dependent methyltransferase [Acidimicrobiales bacterium]